MIKKFNNWISNNFKGLSAHTLCQFLQMEGYSSDYADNIVYVDLWRVFTKQAHDVENNSYIFISEMVQWCEWL